MKKNTKNSHRLFKNNEKKMKKQTTKRKITINSTVLTFFKFRSTIQKRHFHRVSNSFKNKPRTRDKTTHRAIVQ